MINECNVTFMFPAEKILLVFGEGIFLGAVLAILIVSMYKYFIENRG